MLSIYKIIERDFDTSLQSKIKTKIDELVKDRWTVGSEQLARSILLLSSAPSKNSDRFFPSSIHAILLWKHRVKQNYQTDISKVKSPNKSKTSVKPLLI